MKKIPMLERFAAQSLVEHDGELIFSKEKFAELIVEECISVMKSTVDESIDIDRKLDETYYWIKSDIKNHFWIK